MSKRIAIIFPNKNSSSETFIKAHVDHLPCQKKILYGGWFPQFIEGDKLLIPKSKTLVGRLVSKVGINKSLREEETFKDKALRQYLNKNRIEAVLAEYGPTGVAVMRACEEANVPLTIHFHGFDAYHLETLKLYSKPYETLFRKARAIITVSKDMTDQLILLGAPNEKIKYNSYGVDVVKFFPSPARVTNPVFFFIGRFVNKKAPHLLILAFAKVRESIPHARLVMGGDGGLGSAGELYSACKQMVKALNLTDAVEFKGELTPDEVAKEMQKSYAYVQHSVIPHSGDSEGTPNAILEAAATGLPVIATRHAGIKDAVIDGKTGYLVDEYDTSRMAERMIELVRDPSLAYQMGQAGRKYMQTNFTMEKSISNLWNIIQNTIPNR